MTVRGTKRQGDRGTRRQGDKGATTFYFLLLTFYFLLALPACGPKKELIQNIPRPTPRPEVPFDRYTHPVSIEDARRASQVLKESKTGAEAAEAALLLGRYRFLKREYGRAAKLFMRVLQADPGGPTWEAAQYLLGLSRKQEGQPLGAVDAFEILMAQAEDDELAARCLYLTQRIIRETLTNHDLEQAVSRYPHSSFSGLALFLVGRNHYEEGSFDEAVRRLGDFLESYPIHPSFPDAERMYLGAQEALGTRVLRIGFLAPLSGKFGAYGLSMKRGVELALRQRPEVGLLVSWDTRGEPLEALKGAKHLVENEKVSVIIGPARSEEVAMVAGYLDREHIPAISPLAGREGLMDLSNSLFRTQLTVGQEARLLARRARDQGFGRIAILAPDDDLGRSMVQAFSEEIEILGGLCMAVEHYKAQTPNAPGSGVYREAIMALGGEDPSEVKVRRRTEDRAMRKASEGLWKKIRAALPATDADIRLALVPLPEKGEMELVSGLGRSFTGYVARALKSVPGLRIVGDETVQEVLQYLPEDSEQRDLAELVIGMGQTLAADWVAIVETEEDGWEPSETPTLTETPGLRRGKERSDIDSDDKMELSMTLTPELPPLLTPLSTPEPVRINFRSQIVDVHTGMVIQKYQGSIDRYPPRTLNPLQLDSVFVSGYWEDLVPITYQLVHYRMNLPILGMADWGLSRVQRLLEDFPGTILFISSFSANSPLVSTRKFVEAFEELYGESPDLYGAQAYEAATYLLEKFQKGARTPQKLSQALRSKETVQGVGGKFNFLPNGDLNRDLPLHRILAGRMDLAPEAAP